MCGQVGLLLGPRRRRAAEYQSLFEDFTALLLLHEHRGPHATGVAWLRRDGEHRIVKQPGPATEFVREKTFQTLADEVRHGTTWLAGHTRWVTRGTPMNNRNNHPIRGGSVIGTHNGTLVNADALVQRLRLPRQTEVDSEVLVRLVNGAQDQDGIDVSQLLRRLRHCQGQMSAALASKKNPNQILLIHGNKPLFVRCHPARKLMTYASEGRLLKLVCPTEEGWLPVGLPSHHLMLVDVRDLETAQAVPFHFKALSRLPAFEDAP